MRLKPRSDNAVHELARAWGGITAMAVACGAPPQTVTRWRDACAIPEVWVERVFAAAARDGRPGLLRAAAALPPASLPPHEPIGCRYIIGDTGPGGTWRFCHEPQAEGAAYCEAHRALCSGGPGRPLPAAYLAHVEVHGGAPMRLTEAIPDGLGEDVRLVLVGELWTKPKKAA